MVTHMGTSLTPDFKNSLAERPGAGRSAMSGRRSPGGLDRVCLVKELSGELQVHLNKLECRGKVHLFQQFISNCEIQCTRTEVV